LWSNGAVTDRDDRYELAQKIALDAARLTLGCFRDPALRIDQKMDRTLVTEADRDAETLLRRALEARYPDDAIVGEEHGRRPGTSGWTWYLDPIDGTQAYARGVPLFGTLVAATRDGRPDLGVICLPAVGEMVHAARGLGCTWIDDLRPTDEGWRHSPGRPARVSRCSSLGEAMFLTTWLQSYQQVGKTELFQRLSEKTGVFRGWGDCYGYALVATGRAEIMVDPVLAAWDAGPMPIILEEAGGRYTSFAGAVDFDATDGVATNGLLHDEVLALLR
jgi:histidinol phosphatase-like enzyme (inositol monophosphatase family)